MRGLEPASYFELRRALREISGLIVGARILKLYHMDDGSIILKLRSESFSGELRIVPGLFFYFVHGGYEKPIELSQVGKMMRSLIEGMRISGASLVEGERILIMELEGRQRLNMICEFLPKGTIVVSDEAGRILACLQRLEMRDRRIAPGERYILPPLKPAPSLETLKEVLERRHAPEKKIVSILASEAGLGGRYAEEILQLAGISRSRKISELSAEEVSRILEVAREVFAMIDNGQPVVAFSPDGVVQPLPYPMKIYESRGWRFERVESLNDAFRIAYEHYLASMLEQEKRRVLEEKLRDLEKRIGERRAKADELSARAIGLRRIAEKLFQASGQIESLKHVPGKHDIDGMRISVDERSRKMLVSDDGVEVELSPDEPIMRQVSRIFDEAKKVMSAAEKLRAEADELEKRVEKLRELMRKSAEELLLRVSARIKPSRAKWYERYRWFITSEGFLAVAGKDASSNIALLKKHLEPDDLVFHAEVRGAAAVILKNGRSSSEQSRIEAAQFAAVYSRAWKEGLRTMTVYYVEPDQISFEPPSGHYLPRGGFIIKGERHYIQTRLELAIGITEDLELVYGPPTAVAERAKSYVKLEPGSKHADELADMILKKLLPGVELDLKTIRDLKEQIKEIIPYGRGNLVEAVEELGIKK
ncbi:MAG: NFACT family protein [Aigarchaeota archaeon]|nr:NFACT family protein [Candidatus Wolframiiraptor gerlachensis]